MVDKDDLPQNEFDVVVVGTGMVESIVAAAAARIGKSVLHLDRNDYYGDVWATLGLEGLEDLTKKLTAHSSVAGDNQPPVENLYKFSNDDVIQNIAYKWSIPGSIPEEEANTKNRLNYLTISENSSDGLKEKVVQKIETQSELTTLDGEAVESESEENLVKEHIKKDTDCDEKREKQVGEEKEDENNKKYKEKEDKQYKKWSVEEMRQQSRKFNIDLAPKVIYSTGVMVDLLLHSCVYRYAEFQSVSQVLARVHDRTFHTARLERVPCTKSEVFSCKSVSVIDKRILMKVLNFCLSFTPESPQYQDLKDQLFIDYLISEKVPNHLIQYIFYSIAMATNNTLFKDAAVRVQCFLKNVGRYGNSPFLWPMYGSGELLQAFCRLSAVYGGVYYLMRGAESLTIDNGICTGVMSNNKHIGAKHVITSLYYTPKQFIQEKNKNKFIYRTILFTDRPLYVDNDKESISILHLECKSENATSPVILLELPPSSGSSPKDLYMVHITYEESSADWSQVKDIIDELFVRSTEDGQQYIADSYLPQFKEWFTAPQQHEEGDNRPRILFEYHFSLLDTCCVALNSSKPSNFHLTHGPDSHVDFHRAVNQAREIFKEMYPDEEFLEPTPDPNEITLNDLIEQQEAGDSTEQTGDSDEQTCDKSKRTDDNTQQTGDSTEQTGESSGQTSDKSQQIGDNPQQTTNSSKITGDIEKQ